MKTTDSVMREKLLNYCDVFDTANGAYLREGDIVNFISHSLAEARREVDERCERAEKLLDDVVTMFGKQNSDLHIIQEVRDLMALRIKEGKSVTATWRRELDLLTGDNPEEAKV